MAAPARDSVFISYSHRNEQWLERILVFLKPFTRNGALSVWHDKYIEVGGLWRREIDVGLQRATVGLLLVSPDFMASDFIMEEELPALVDAAGRGQLTLVWVPVSASHWDLCPLEERQSAWDPTQPLDSLPEHQRNSALVKITRKVAEAAQKYATAVPAPISMPRRDERMVPAIASPPEPRGPGDLHDVPALPSHFVPRTEDLDHLRSSLLAGGPGAMGITGEPYRMGLHGQGGIGKSVLAAALARDDQVRLAFPDGVFWVTVGNTPDVPRLQSALLAEAGAETTAVTDVPQGRKHLAERFGGRAVLLVLDDVWDYRDALAFDVLAPASRLLVTTRDNAVLTAVGAHVETVERLPESAALELLVRWSGRADESWSEAVRRIAEECGYLPLALSLAGARVRDGVAWEVVAQALEAGRLEFLDHPYGSVFGSMRLSVDALPPDERQRYLELAALPEDENVPEPVVLALWKQTAGLDDLRGRDLLARLRGKALLEIVDAEGKRKVGLHDLQHDFLRISVPDLKALHGELLSSLAAGLPTSEPGRAEWWRLPPGEPYAWLHLARHLAAAGREEELRGLLFDCRWLEAKLRASGLPALLADFAVLPPDEELTLVAGALRLSGHVLAGDPGQLRSQLTGRLLGMDRSGIRMMLSQAAVTAAGGWLRPMVASLTPPTGALLRTLVGHTGWVLAVGVTQDGRRIVSGSDDGTVKVWDLETGAEERTLAGHAGEVRAVGVTPDGRRVVSGSDNGTVKVWDLETGMEERTLAGHAGGVNTVGVTPDGQRVVSGSWDRTVKVWDLETGAEERTLAGHGDGVWAVGVTPDGQRAVSGSWDRTVKVWDLETGAEERTLAGHAGEVWAVEVTQDGRRAVSGSSDRTVKVWDLEAGMEERTLAGHAGEVLAVGVTPDGRRVVSGSGDGMVKVWDLETGTEERTLAGHAGWWVNAVGVMPDGRRVVSGSNDGTVKVWDLEAGVEERRLAGHAGEVLALGVTPDGRRAVSGSRDGTVKVWDLETGAEERTLAGHLGWVVVVGVTLDGRRAVSGSWNGTVKVWDLEAGTEERTLAGLVGGVWTVGVTPDGRRAVSGSLDGTVKVWDLETGAEERTLAGHAGWVWAVGLTPDGRRVVSGSSDGTVKVWDLETGAEERTLAGHTDGVLAVGVTPDSRRVVSGSSDGTVKVWDLETGTQERTLAGHAGGVVAVGVMPDGRRVVSGSRDGTVKVWDLETGMEERTLTGHRGGVLAVGVAPDGQRVVSGSSDGTMRVWDVDTGKEELTLVSHAGGVNAVGVTPDGQRALSGSWDKTVQVWNLETRAAERTLAGHAGGVNAVGVTPDSQRAVSGSWDGTVKVWDLETGTEERTLAGHMAVIVAVGVTPDGRHAVSGARDGTVKVCDPETGGILANFTADASVDCCAVVPDGTLVCAGDRLGRVHFLSLEGLPQQEWQSGSR